MRLLQLPISNSILELKPDGHNQLTVMWYHCMGHFNTSKSSPFPLCKPKQDCGSRFCYFRTFWNGIISYYDFSSFERLCTIGIIICIVFLAALGIKMSKSILLVESCYWLWLSWWSSIWRVVHNCTKWVLLKSYNIEIAVIGQLCAQTYTQAFTYSIFCVEYVRSYCP